MFKHRYSPVSAIGLTLAVLPVLSCTSETGLRFSPESPPAGSEINVNYVASSNLADESELVLRGTYRTADGAVELLTIRNMQRGSGSAFSTRFTLPAAAVYAAFVVEDVAGQRLDANGGRLFDLLVHDGDGMPLYRGLVGRADEFEDRNVHTSLEALQRAMDLYPDSLDGWSRLRSLERRALGSSGGDSLFVWHQENFAGIDERYRDRDGPAALQRLWRRSSDYAGEVGDAVQGTYWRARVGETVGSFSWAQSVTLPIRRQWRADGDTEAAMNAFERYWPVARRGQIAALALSTAIMAENLAAIDRWIPRNLGPGGRGTSPPPKISPKSRSGANLPWRSHARSSKSRTPSARWAAPSTNTPSGSRLNEQPS